MSVLSARPAATVRPAFVDPRSPRFAAWITTAVLAIALLTSSGWLLGVQAAVFGIGAFAGLRYAPYPAVFRHFIAPRLAPTSERESAAPVRFAQGVGFAFAAVGASGYLTGLPILGAVATALALAAAFLNAAFGLCLGCEFYLLFRRLTTTHPTATPKKGVTA
jgi:hypothetical protein